MIESMTDGTIIGLIQKEIFNKIKKHYDKVYQKQHGVFSYYRTI